MKNIKSFFIYAWIISQIIVVVYLWAVLVYTAFTGADISKALNWEWWVFLFMLDLWTGKFLKELLGKKTKTSEQ